MERMISGSCTEAGHAPDMGDQNPGLGALSKFVPVPCKSAATAAPCKCALHDPSARQHPEAFGGVGSFDDSQRPAPETDKCSAQLRSAILIRAIMPPLTERA